MTPLFKTSLSRLLTQGLHPVRLHTTATYAFPVLSMIRLSQLLAQIMDDTCDTIDFCVVGDSVQVRDLWSAADLGTFTNAYTAMGVASHASAAIKLSLI